MNTPVPIIDSLERDRAQLRPGAEEAFRGTGDRMLAVGGTDVDRRDGNQPENDNRTHTS